MSVRLGLDASQLLASCAVSINTEIVASFTMEKPIENFTTLIRKTISQANISLNDLNEIVVCIGPGSQTGARTAVVTGNALALALGIPVSGVLSTDAATVIAPHSEVFNIAVSAGRRRWYVEGYEMNEDKLQRLDKMQLLDDLPEEGQAPFDGDVNDFEKTCAYGCLVVAEQQRHLIKQSLLSEIVPYERSE